jgi:hypothetical protein
MKVISDKLSTEHKNMLSNIQVVVCKSYLAVDPRYDILVTTMRTAWGGGIKSRKSLLVMIISWMH